MEGYPPLSKSRLYCPISKFNGKFFFSLVDYRNSYFTSDNPDKIIEFYNSFKDRDDLIEWMKERPKGVANIYEVNGDKEIIVVIPTADFNGKYAKECKNIFKGLHIIFVESGGKGDFYFNYAHNCNVGIRKAIEYNPKWIIVSNDDVQAEKVENLIKILDNVNAEYCIPNNQYSNRSVRIFRVNKSVFVGYLIYNFFIKGWKISRFIERMALDKRYSKDLILISKDSGMIYKLLDFFANSVTTSFENFADFGVFQAKTLQNYIYDESFINGHEDTELCIRLAAHGIRASSINFRAEQAEGGGNSVGKGNSLLRIEKDWANQIMLSEKLKNIQK